jgi:hypothetical protein
LISAAADGRCIATRWRTGVEDARRLRRTVLASSRFRGQTEPNSVAEVTLDATPATGRPVIPVFTFGHVAERVDAMDETERRRAVIEALTARLGPRVARPAEVIETPWWKQEWTRGCSMAHLTPGTLTRYGSLIRAPFGRVHWAGTETSTISHGAIDGAVRSGERAAKSSPALAVVMGRAAQRDRCARTQRGASSSAPAKRASVRLVRSTSDASATTVEVAGGRCDPDPLVRDPDVDDLRRDRTGARTDSETGDEADRPADEEADQSGPHRPAYCGTARLQILRLARPYLCGAHHQLARSPGVGRVGGPLLEQPRVLLGTGLVGGGRARAPTAPGDPRQLRPRFRRPTTRDLWWRKTGREIVLFAPGSSQTARDQSECRRSEPRS